MWHGTLVSRINALMDQPAKPFNTRHGSQIRHVTSFDWLDFTALRGISEEYSELLAQSVFIDDVRRSTLCKALDQRISMLERIAVKRVKRNKS